MARKKTKTEQPNTETKVADNSIGGKLGMIAKAIATPKGATLDQLIKKTSWQPHTVRAALSRLRTRGMVIILADVDGCKAYTARKAD
jgi:transcription initiation factor IIE alpha subunit